ncbi:MAG: helix-turn-helix transcriptional regulator [Phaeodactylibacter sp.]|nr:helix-turn-helix transcriptional regulator [Phaeodactylibacter sp.]
MSNKHKGLFAAAFRAYLDGSGQSQAAVAEAAGMSPSNLHSYLTSEPGKARREPAIATALRLAKAAGARIILEGGQVRIESASSFTDPRDRDTGS